jgi:hypothetical protein
VAVAAVLGVALVASACDTSPVAATVGSQQIKQTALNAQLRALSGDQTYVAAAESSGATVTGDSPGTWNSSWVADVLSTQVYSAAASQYVAKHGIQPGDDVLAAARGLGEALSGDVWLSFPASYRDQLTQLYADLAQVAPAPTDVAALMSVFDQYRADFFTEVCVRQQAFSVTGANGAIDFPASLAAAQAAVTGGGLQGGTLTCYSQAEFETQPKEFVHTVKALAPGQAQAPQRTEYGYSVLGVDSRQSEEFTPAVQAVLGLGVNNGQAFNAALTHVLSQTRVQINPQYGTWQPASSSGPPQVVPPTGPADALAALTPTTTTGG